MAHEISQAAGYVRREDHGIEQRVERGLIAEAVAAAFKVAAQRGKAVVDHAVFAAEEDRGVALALLQPVPGQLQLERPAALLVSQPARSVHSGMIAARPARPPGCRVLNSTVQHLPLFSPAPGAGPNRIA